MSLARSGSNSIALHELNAAKLVQMAKLHLCKENGCLAVVSWCISFCFASLSFLCSVSRLKEGDFVMLCVGFQLCEDTDLCHPEHVDWTSDSTTFASLHLYWPFQIARKLRWTFWDVFQGKSSCNVHNMYVGKLHSW